MTPLRRGSGGQAPRNTGQAGRNRAKAGRNAMLAKLHLARRDLALEEESYRAVLERVTGRRSGRELSDRQLEAALKEFQRLGWKPKRKEGARTVGDRPIAYKIAALWRSLWLLGEVENLAGLDTFVERQTGVGALRWLAPEEASAVIEALRAWCARAGFEVPSTTRDGGRAAKEKLVLALRMRLDRISLRHSVPLPDLRRESPRQLDAMAEELGRRLRAVKEAARGDAETGRQGQ